MTMSPWNCRLFLVLIVCGCGDPAGPSRRGGAAPSQRQPQRANASSYAGRFCQDVARRAQACGRSRKSFATCQHGVHCSAAVMRADAHPMVLSCIANRRCGRPDEACFIDVMSRIRPSAEAQRFTRACDQTQARCRVGEDLCHAGRSGAFTDAFYANLGACFSAPCGGMDRCMQQAIRRSMPQGCSLKSLW